MYPARIIIIQILLLLFVLFALSRVLIRYRAGDLSWKEFLWWTMFWLAAAIVVLFPDLTFYLARIVGITRGADLIVYLSLAGLFFLAFRLMVKIERLNKNLTVLSRKFALKEEDRLLNEREMRNSAL